MNYQNCCRTCLGNEKEMRPITSSVIISGENIQLLDILENFYNYKISSDNSTSYPQNICIVCVHQLTITYSFKLLIDNSFKKLSETSNIDSICDIYDCNQDSEDQTLYENITKTKTKRTNVKTAKVKQILCVECKSKFKSVKQLKAHCVDNHSVKSTAGRDCQYCFEKFENFQSLVFHRKLHFNPYVCENCWSGFLLESDYASHVCDPIIDYNKQEKKEKVFRQCDQCGKSYPAGYIRIHMRIHSTDRPYSCKYCPKKFKVLGGLHSHIQWNHRRTRNHKCEICNATFISSSSRSSHVRKHHLKERKFPCDSCGKRFFSTSEVKRHMLTHTGVKNFHCHLCDKSYQTRYGLNVHLKSHTQILMNALN